MSFPDWLFIKTGSVQALAQLILFLTIAGILWKGKRTAKASRYLWAAFVPMSGFSLLCLLHYSIIVPWWSIETYNKFLSLAELNAVIVSLTLVLRFAYLFPRPLSEQRQEVRVAIGVSTAGFCVSALASVLLFHALSARQLCIMAAVIIVLHLVGLIVVFWRRSMLFSQHQATTPSGERLKARWSAFGNLHGRDARACRAFAFLFLSAIFPALLALVQFITLHRILPASVFLSMIALWLMLFFFSFIMIYLNFAPETTSFMTKLILSTLVTVLAAIGLLGELMNYFELTDYMAYPTRVQLSNSEYSPAKAAPQEIPPEVGFIMSRPADTPPGRYHLHFARHGHVDVRILETGECREQQIICRFAPSLDGFYLLKRVDKDGRRYVIGFVWQPLLETLTPRMTIVAALLVGSALVIVGVFPLFFRLGLVNPLNRLLKGVRQVNEGNLEVIVPQNHHDEIGFLTQSFNTMVAQLNTLVHNLEDRVSERTQQIEAQKEELEVQAEELLRARVDAESAQEKAEAANLAKSQFLSNMSHELRTPLNGVLGYAQFLKGKADLDTTVKDGLDVIQESGQHLLTLINDILDIAKIEARKLELFPTEIDVMPFLESIVAVIRMKAQQSDVQFAQTFEPGLPACIEADEQRLRQVLLNLLGNAVKFTESGGTVTLRVNRKQKADSRNQKDGDGEVLETAYRRPPTACLSFEVSDTGVGIPAEQLGTIFEPFEQAGDAGQRSQGTGLGLAISRQLVGLMGGCIQVTSQPGVGSTFWFEAAFPIIADDARIEPEPSRIITGYEAERRYRILIVDDLPENQFVLVNLLEQIGFETAVALNGQEALECLMPESHINHQSPITNHQSFDMVLMDLMMPVMDGFEAVKEIRRLEEHRTLPIVAVSANLTYRNRVRDRESGFDGFLPKPVDAQKLYEILAAFLPLSWNYDFQAEEIGDAGQSSDDAELVPPSHAELEVLYELARLGLLRDVQEYALRMEEQDAQHRAFARRLKTLADDYDQERILALLQHHRND